MPVVDEIAEEGIARMVAQLPVVAAGERGAIESLLYGQFTVPFWVVGLVVGLAVTAGLVYLLRRLAD